jgi:nucleotide-binding universal stress UspA family protein
MDSVEKEPKSNVATATRAGGQSVDRRPLRLLVGSAGGAGSDDALALARALDETTEVELIATAGDGAVGLKELAAAESADLIVLARPTVPIGPTRPPPGAIERDALDGAPCAVAVAPPGLADAPVSLRTIAVGYDGSMASAIALHRAVDLAERTGAQLLILGAVEISIGLAGYETRQPKDLEQARMERHVRQALERVPPTVSAESRLLFGPAERVLVEAAEEVDLLVLGSRGSYGPLHHLALGSVAAEVVRSSTRPTLVTPDD